MREVTEADWDDAPEMPAALKYTVESAETALRNGWADLIGFGRPFVANPDLPERLRNGWSLNVPDANGFPLCPGRYLREHG